MEWGGTLVVLATPPMNWSVPPMPAKVSVPDSLSSLLQRFRSCFTAPGYEVFIAMFTGFILRPVERTVCGMLTGAGLAGVWHHSRAHRFFAGTRWDVQQVGLILAALVVDRLLPPDDPILLAIDETLTRRRGPKVFAASWWHDGSAAGATKIGYGNSWVVLAIVVTLPFCRRPIALPILFTLCVKGGRSKPDLGRDLLDQVAEALPTRTIHLVGDAAYGAGHFAGLGHHMSITTRARSNAVFHHPTPGGQRKTRPTPTPRRTHRHPHRHRQPRYQEQHLDRHPDQPIRHHHHRAHHRNHRPLVRGLAHRPGPRHPGHRQPPQNHRQQELRHRDSDHRHDRDRRRDRRPLRVPLVHRSLLPRREKHHRRRRNPEPGRKSRSTERPFHIHGPDHHRPLVHHQRQTRNADRRTPQKRPLVHHQNRPVHDGHALRPARHAHLPPN